MKDKRAKVVFLAAVFLIMFVPMMLMKINTPPGYRFTGFSAGGVDYYTQLTKLQWGYNHWTYPDRYTPEDTKSVPIYFIYMLLGHIGRLLGLDPVSMLLYSQMAIILTAFFVLCKMLEKESAYAVIFAVLLFPYPFLKFFMWPCAFSMFGIPHYGIDIIGFYFIFEGYRKKKTVYGIIGSYLTAVVHPFLLALAYLVPLADAVLFRRKDVNEMVKYVGISALAVMPYMAVLFRDFSSVSWLKEWRRQALADYNPVILLAVYGVPFYIALYYIARNFKKLDDDEKFHLSWIVCALLLTFAMPLTNRDEYLFMFSLPVGVFASRQMQKTADELKIRKGVMIVFAALLITLNVPVALSNYFKMREPAKAAYNAVYLPAGYVQGFEFMRRDAKKDCVVMARWDTGNLIPYYANLRPYVGHVSETMNYEQKKEEADGFYDGELNEKQRNELLKKYSVEYVVFDTYLHRDSDFHIPGYTEVFKNRYMTVLKKAE